MKKTISTKTWIIAIGLIFALCVGITTYLLWPRQRENTVVGPIAVVYQNGVLVDVVDLGTVEESYTKVFPGVDDAENTVEFAHGQVRMSHSTCPDQICVSMGWQDGSWFFPISCLPNNVTILIDTLEEPEESPAATSGLDGVTR